MFTSPAPKSYGVASSKPGRQVYFGPTGRANEGISCISGEESSRISLGMCSPLREERNGQITAKKRSKPGFFPVEACAPVQQC
ncbi:hypothetical protein AgCh_034224 [Apium graveolens]